MLEHGLGKMYGVRLCVPSAERLRLVGWQSFSEKPLRALVGKHG